MKKRVFTLIFAALLTCVCCISCESDSKSDSNGGGTSDTSYSRPEQSGKTRNERIKAADQAAESALTACNAALTELNGGSAVEGWIDSDTSAATEELESVRTKTAEIAGDIEEPYSIYVKNGVAVAAVALKIDFYGTYPAGLNYANYSDALGEAPTLDDVKAYAISLSEGK